MKWRVEVAAGIVAFGALAVCSSPQALADHAPGYEHAPQQGAEEPLDPRTVALRQEVDNIVVIYAENRSFDSLYGRFPRAHGLGEVLVRQGQPGPGYVPQKDRDGVTPLPNLPQTWSGVTAAGNADAAGHSRTVTQAQSDGLPNAPFSIETAFTSSSHLTLTTADVTRDLGHAFFQNAMEINGGSNDLFAAWVDAGGLTLGHLDTYRRAGLYALARRYVLADEFFQGAFGGSFLNHQYLICACAPQVPDSFVTTKHPTLNVLASPNAKGVPQLAVLDGSPASALDGPPLLRTGAIAPKDYFGAGDGYRAVNTMQPPYQPSGNFPAAAATDLRYADASRGSTLPPQTQTNVGDLLSAQGIPWAWYASAWNDAIRDGEQPAGSVHSSIYAPATPRALPGFQAHHQPFNYFAAFDPAAHADARAAHLKDYDALQSEAAAGTLPPVVFYKPSGGNNQHPGYANATDGDEHIAELVKQLQAAPQWQHMIIIVTYDEYGGAWDHFPVPQGDLLGPGTRIPAIVISPIAKRHMVDHTPYDTGSVLRLITRRFGLPTLQGLTTRDAALKAHGAPPMGDFSDALDLNASQHDHDRHGDGER
jgi:acid phosphatase